MRKLIVTLLLLVITSIAYAECQAYVYIHNWTNDDLQVYIDGQNYGVAYKGYPTWFYVDPGHHKIESYRLSDSWKAAKACVYVGCFPKGEVTIAERDF